MALLPKRRTHRGASFGDTDGFIMPTNEIKNSDNSFWSKIRWKQLLIIYIWFIGLAYYFERIKPRSVLNKCLWNDWEDWPQSANPHHSLIYGDPQIVDDFSYPTRSKILLKFTQLLSDNYLHRNHQLINSVLNPHSILYIGDLFDGGREWEDNKWFAEFKRFNKVFDSLAGVRQFKQIPGNHDIGFGMGVDFDKYSRFKSYFGNADDYTVLGNHSFVLLDSVSLSCNNDTRVKMTSENFLNTLKDPNHPAKNYPRIVLTHVPLYRFTELQECGSFRESKKPFPVMRGKQYQTVLEFEMSQNILDWINPSMIFSGDDHDYCHIKHPLGKYMSKNFDDYKIKEGMTPGYEYSDEITVKSSAMTGGIKQPAVQLISLWNPIHEEESKDDDWKFSDEESMVVDGKTVKTKLCYLPNPYQPLIHYSISFGMSLLWIFICTIWLSFGTRLNLRLNGHFITLKDRVQKFYKKDRINLTEMEPKKVSTSERIFKSLFLDWKVERRRDWYGLFVNWGLIVVGYFIILMSYFNSI